MKIIPSNTIAEVASSADQNLDNVSTGATEYHPPRTSTGPPALMFISAIFSLKKSARFCSLTSVVILPMCGPHDWHERLELLLIPILNDWTSMNGGNPRMEKMGGIWITLAHLSKW